MILCLKDIYKIIIECKLYNQSEKTIKTIKTI